MDEQNNVQTMEEAYNPEGVKRKKWSEFIERDIVDFFDAHKLEKMTVEDGNGNKAKISRTKDNELKIEQSSITIL